MINKVINGCLTNCMLIILKKLKGKTLKYIECVPMNGFSLIDNRVFESIRLSIGQKSVDITNNIHAIPQTDEEKQTGEPVLEYTWFECFLREKNEEYNSPTLIQKPVKYLLNEKINDIVIVTDTISSKDGYLEKTDRAILIRTNDNLYSFIRNAFWEDSIYIRTGSKIEGLPSEIEISDHYGEEGLSVKREYTFL